jgi:hypothetical protein
MQIPKPLRVGKRERYEVTIAGWLDGESFISFTVAPDETKATLHGVPDVDGATIGFYLDGVESGTCKVHINYATATRSDCETVRIKVANC